jgi:hypothetical protein
MPAFGRSHLVEVQRHFRAADEAGAARLAAAFKDRSWLGGLPEHVRRAGDTPTK